MNPFGCGQGGKPSRGRKGQKNRARGTPTVEYVGQQMGK